ncbi:hypothetical protein PLESTB_000940200 [Pleodorina starrii]|uniref:Uncharacterized protein n=1 Tax=Pleodorina starrii TaxID=330485 RepID=A0A9W6BN31_9CHLO|nr:hypothetical protein PLESTB_000940200 [Pleodorina starrii]
MKMLLPRLAEATGPPVLPGRAMLASRSARDSRRERPPQQPQPRPLSRSGLPD